MAIISNTNTITCWCNYVDGGGDNHMSQSHGISSVSDHGTGDFTVNFGTSFTNTGYGFYEGGSSENSHPVRGANGSNVETSNKNTGSCKVISVYGSRHGQSQGNYNSMKTTTWVFIGDI